MVSASSTTDRIHKEVLLRAPRARVWQALSDMREFGAWFGIDLPDGSFRQGAQVAGQVTHPGYTHLTLRLSVEQVEPERLLSFRWHPDALEPNVDYDQEPTTLVAFELQGVPDGILLTIDESGFDQLPAHRRADAYRGNESGWAEQMVNIARHIGDGA
jgi:uncharacterized protein YndB with AHSA1/START domain